MALVTTRTSIPLDNSFEGLVIEDVAELDVVVTDLLVQKPLAKGQARLKLAEIEEILDEDNFFHAWIVEEWNFFSFFLSSCWSVG